MPYTVLRLVKRCMEYKCQEDVSSLPQGLRGIYVLYHRRRKAGKAKYDVVYVGMAAGRRGGIRGRLTTHARKKTELWTHFSAFEVWDNITNEEVAELEGLFRHIYRKDTRANRLNVQKRYKKLVKVRQNDVDLWLASKSDDNPG